MNERSGEMYQAASMYYVHGDTMDNIARQLGVSRSTVSRLLKEARDTGLVRITLSEPVASRDALARSIEKAFKVRAHVVSVKDGSSEVTRLDRVARVAAGLATDSLVDGMTVGVAWGTTLAAIASNLPRREMRGVNLVQLNGAANPSTSGLPYAGGLLQQMAQAWSAQTQIFPVPAFFDYAETREMLWRERSVRRVVEMQSCCDMAIFGVGATRGPLPSHVYSSGYLEKEDFEQLSRDKVVGDVCTVFLREDGTWRDIEMNSRASGPTPAALQRIPRRICVVASEFKVRPLLAALRARVATDLVLDDQTARALLEAVVRR